jgi:hypothetical protein
MINLRSFDLNLLIVFEAIFETGSIVRAADRLALSQSATSHAIGRFRDACQDDLFVRVGQGITPTPVALRIFPEVKKSLDGLRRSLGDARGFDLARDRQPRRAQARFSSGRPQRRKRRGLEAERLLCSGPGRLCQALGITREHDGLPLDRPPFELRERAGPVQVHSGTRVGITRATELPWRYAEAGSRFLSRPLPPA